MVNLHQMNNETLTINTDGGSRGNPGHAACAFVAVGSNGLTFSESKYLGIATNNFAEYQGVLLAINWLNKNINSFKGFEIKFVLDSELVVKQINGIYRVKDENLTILHRRIVSQIKLLNSKVSFTNVPREKNKEADKLVNQELDKNIQ